MRHFHEKKFSMVAHQTLCRLEVRTRPHIVHTKASFGPNKGLFSKGSSQAEDCFTETMAAAFMCAGKQRFCFLLC